jgi:hypothetical protein
MAEKQGAQSPKGSLSHESGKADVDTDVAVKDRGGATGNPNRTRPDLEQPRRDKALAEVREVHDQIREQWLFHNRTEIQRVVTGVEDSGKVVLSSANGRVYVSASSGEVILDHDGVADLVRQANELFQAVS